MTHSEFIEECNKRGAEKMKAPKKRSKRDDSLAELCGEVPPFKFEGLSFLAGLVSDKYTASGRVVKGGAKTDSEKVWSEPFLSQFNPKGFTFLNKPNELEDFARQVAEGSKFYIPPSVRQFMKKSEVK